MKKASKSPGPPSLEPAMSRGFFRRLQPQSDFQSNLPALARSRLRMVGSGSVADDSDHGRGRLTHQQEVGLLGFATTSTSRLATTRSGTFACRKAEVAPIQ
jgi:hypothetical protein